MIKSCFAIYLNPRIKQNLIFIWHTQIHVFLIIPSFKRFKLRFWKLILKNLKFLISIWKLKSLILKTCKILFLHFWKLWKKIAMKNRNNPKKNKKRRRKKKNMKVKNMSKLKKINQLNKKDNHKINRKKKLLKKIKKRMKKWMMKRIQIIKI